MKIAIVTGASRGIGKAIALQFLKDGYAVHGIYAQSDQAAKTLEFENEHLAMHKVDLASRAAIKAFTQELAGQKIDVLVNNAGIYEDKESWDEFDLGTWDRTMAINLEAPLILTNLMKDSFNSGGSIVNIVTTDIDYAAYVSFSYAASKASLANLTKTMAALMAKKGVRANGLALGWIDTDMGAEEVGLSEFVNKKTPLGRSGTSQEVANVISFVVSDKASFVTGAIIPVDGGYSIVDEIIQREGEL